MHTHTCENSNGVFGGLQSRLLLACGRFHVTKPENEVFYPLLIKTAALWGEVPPHCPGLSDEILKTRSEQSCQGLDLI